MATPDSPAESRLRRIRFRAWHRGTREADYLIGCYFDRFHRQWGEAELIWFEALIEEDDADVMGWALGTLAIPPHYAGAPMARMQRIDYVSIAR